MLDFINSSFAPVFVPSKSIRVRRSAFNPNSIAFHSCRCNRTDCAYATDRTGHSPKELRDCFRGSAQARVPVVQSKGPRTGGVRRNDPELLATTEASPPPDRIPEPTGLYVPLSLLAPGVASPCKYGRSSGTASRVVIGLIPVHPSGVAGLP